MNFIVEYDNVAQNNDESIMSKGDEIENSCNKETNLVQTSTSLETPESHLEPNTTNETFEAKVLYTYHPQNDDELEIQEGQMVEVIRLIEKGWYEGICDGKRGVFPSNYVSILVNSDTIPGTEDISEQESIDETVTTISDSELDFPSEFKVVYTYNPQNEDEIAIEKGQIVEVIRLVYIKMTVEEGWYEGICNGKRGVFPSNYITKLENRNDHKMSKARVLFKYLARESDELTLTSGDIVNVLDKNSNDEGWWKGELNGLIGLFPDNFVEEISNDEHTQQQIVHDNESLPLQQETILSTSQLENSINEQADGTYTNTILVCNPSKATQSNPLCQICVTKNVEVSMVHLSNNTGHQICCMECAQQLKSNNMKCPICREDIDLIIKNFIS